MVIILFIHSYPLCLLSWVFNPQISPQRNRLGISQGKQITQIVWIPLLGKRWFLMARNAT